ncbi:transglutaminase domain-containing protein [Desulfacinum infernum]|uniref:transglutaminase domain-containing protein n=1 Tax=Desulfacinum infernum TaxID=35837 RepID=UPI001C49CBD4
MTLGREPVVDVTRWQHCWAEFFLPGYGWVPVDPADVRKIMLKKGLTLKDPETRRWRDYFWGGWDPYRVRLAVGGTWY